jgi:citrate lyase beta subunit
MKLFVYSPTHSDANSNGIVEYDILCATMRLTGEEKGLVRFITDKKGWYWHIDDVNKNYVEGCVLKKTEKAFDAEEGTEFIGWNRTKQYRLTKDEIESFVVESKEKVGNETKIMYKVFVPCIVAKVLPAEFSGNTQNRGYLIK